MIRYFLLPILILALISSCNQPSKEQAESSGKVLNKKEFVDKFFMESIDTNKQFPELTFETPEGNPIKPEDMKGKVLFINFWATWCPPCRQELPDMEKLNQQMKGTPFLMLVVNSSEKKEKVDQFLNKYPYQFQVALDENGVHTSGFGVRGLPTTILVSRQGTMLAQAVGPRNWNHPDIVTYLKKLSKEPLK